MIDYEVRLERCKREDTKELIIQCLDKASIDNQQQIHDSFIEAMKVVGLGLLVIILVVVFLNWVFK